MPTIRRLAVISAWLVAVGCGAPGSILRVIDVVNPDGSFGLKNVEVTTLTDLDGVTGEAAWSRAHP